MTEFNITFALIRPIFQVGTTVMRWGGLWYWMDSEVKTNKAYFTGRYHSNEVGWSLALDDFRSQV